MLPLYAGGWSSALTVSAEACPSFYRLKGVVPFGLVQGMLKGQAASAVRTNMVLS